MPSKEKASPSAVVIKKYANRRLYNTQTSTYVTLEDLCHMVKGGADFVVYDAKTGEDITRLILTQIIFEQEAKGYNLLPIGFLKTLIRFHDAAMAEVMRRYLEASMESFLANQEKFGTYFKKAPAPGAASPFAGFEEAAKQNMQMFEQTMKMFNPFGTYFDNSKKK